MNNIEYKNTITGIAKSGRQGSYMVLCYARMRLRMEEGEWFTRTDYFEFQLEKINRNKIKEYTLRLTKSGFLEKHPNGIMWRITDEGIRAIRDLDKTFSLMNPDDKSETSSAIQSRNKKLKEEEKRILDRITLKAPHFTK